MKYYKSLFALTLTVFAVLVIGGFHFPEIFGTAVRGKQFFVIGAITLTISAAVADMLGHYLKFNAKNEETGELKNPPALHDYVIVIGKGLAAIGVVALIMSRAEDISGVDKNTFTLSQQRQVEQTAVAPTAPVTR